MMDLTGSYSGQELSQLSLDFPEKIRCILAQKHLTTVGKVLKTSKLELVSYGLTEEEADVVKSSVSAHFECTTFMTALEYSSILATKWRHITFRCRALDRVTNNGLPIRGITEIVGESGCGKSQICLQLALNVQLSLADGGLEKSAVFICTEDAFPSKRLVQMVGFYKKEYHHIKWLDNIFIEHCSDSAHLMKCIFNRLPRLMQQHSIGLVVIDSIAGAFRIDNDAITRADNMRKTVSKLQTLADEHECAVVCVNQVTASMNESVRDKCVPSLGLAWSNLATTQFKIRKTYKQVSQLADSTILSTPITVRSFEIGFSPSLPDAVAEFIITEKGVCDVPS